jgi:nucleotide sugar dehydrogenase
MNIGIIGQGFVGNAVYQKFKNFFNVFTYDLNSKLCNSNFKEINTNCSLVFICLPTPMNSDGSCDISIVENMITKFSSQTIIVNKSTVPPGTTERFNAKYKNLQIVFNPEFLTERNAVQDFNNQNRIIIGGPRPATTNVKNIFSKVFPNAHIIKTGSTHAEMIKYFTNSFLATKVSFANEIYDLCVKLDLDYDKVIEYSVLDKRIGKSHLNVPGPDGHLGFGGHCLPKDLSALIKLSDEMGSINYLLKSVIKTNDTIRRNRDWEKMKGRAVN